MFVDRDEAWVDYNETFRWIENGQRLLVESERDGWRHAYAVSRDGDARLVTTGAFDILSIAGVDEAGGWLYYIASPANATQRYLYRSRLDGRGTARARDAGGGEPARTPTTCRPIADGRFTATRASTCLASRIRSACPTTPSSASSRTTRRSRRRSAPMLAGRTEMLQVDVGEGVELDGWLIKPRAFDPSKKYPIMVYVYGEPAGTTVTRQLGRQQPRAPRRAGRRGVPGRELRQPRHPLAEGRARGGR